MFQILRKRGSAWSGGGGYSAATLAYKTRVEADGGTVHSLDVVEAAFALMDQRSLSPAAVWGACYGYKTKDSPESGVDVLYDLIGTNDLYSYSTYCPIWEASKAGDLPAACFYGLAGSDYLILTSGITAKTILTVIKKHAVSNQRLLHMNSNGRYTYLPSGSSGNGASAYYTAVSGDYPITDLQVFNFQFDSDGSAARVGHNGTFGDWTGGQDAIGTFGRISPESGTSGFLEADYFEDWMFTDLLSDVQNGYVNSFLMSKCGIS